MLGVGKLTATELKETSGMGHPTVTHDVPLDRILERSGHNRQGEIVVAETVTGIGERKDDVAVRGLHVGRDVVPDLSNLVQ